VALNLSPSRHDQSAVKEAIMPAEAKLSVERLAARIECVERLNRALCFVVALALVISVAALTVAHFSRANTVAAERFAVLKDKTDG
jgi:hypothetical protein